MSIQIPSLPISPSVGVCFEICDYRKHSHINTHHGDEIKMHKCVCMIIYLSIYIYIYIYACIYIHKDAQVPYAYLHSLSPFYRARLSSQVLVTLFVCITICMSMFEHVWVWMNMHEYVRAYMSMYEYAWVSVSMFEHLHATWVVAAGQGSSSI